MPTSVSLIVIVVLLLANGFFVAAEFALVKARGTRIQSMALQGSSSATMTLRIQRNLEAYLAACQLGITMASLGLGWVGEPAVAALLEPLFLRMGLDEALIHTLAFIIGFLVFSSLHIVIGEQLPKTVAIRRSEQVSLWIAYPLHACYIAVWPLNWLLNNATGVLLRWFGVAEASHADVYTSEEIRGLVKSASDHGEIVQEKANMLSNLFEFYKQHASSVMIPRNSITTIDINASAEQNLKSIVDSRHSRFPVIDSQNNDEIVGLLLAKDIQNAMFAGEIEPWQNLKVLTREPLVVSESQSVPVLFEIMRSKHAHMAMIVNEYGEFVGIVTLEDMLEEIVGEIHDEMDDDEVPALRQIQEGEWDADGLIPLHDLNRATGLLLDDEPSVNTLSGYFMEKQGRLPKVGDYLIVQGYSLTVTEEQDHRAGRVLITQVEQEAGDSLDIAAGAESVDSDADDDKSQKSSS